MPVPVNTYVYADDPILQAGVSTQLRMRPEIRVIDAADVDRAEVAVIVADTLDDNTIRVLKAVQRGGVPRTVLVARVIDDGTLAAAAEAGVAGLVRRSEATADSLVRAITRVAAGEGEVPADLLGRLLGQVGRLQRQVLAPARPGVLRAVRTRVAGTCAWWPTGTTPRRSPASCVTASARSRTSCTT